MYKPEFCKTHLALFSPGPRIVALHRHQWFTWLNLTQSLVESAILGNLNIAPQLQEEDAVGEGDNGGPEDPDVVGLDVDDEDGDEEHEEEVEHGEEAAKAPGDHILGNQLLL